MGIDKRLIALIELLGLTPAEFADKINVQRSGISHITSGRNKPSLLFLENTLNAFPNVSSDWLVLGKGKPFRYQNASDNISNKNRKNENSAIFEDEENEIFLEKNLNEETEFESKINESDNSGLLFSFENLTDEERSYKSISESKKNINIPSKNYQKEQNLVNQKLNDSTIKKEESNNTLMNENLTSAQDIDNIQKLKIQESKIDIKRKIEKIMILYKDGTFEIYEN